MKQSVTKYDKLRLFYWFVLFLMLLLLCRWHIEHISKFLYNIKIYPCNSHKSKEKERYSSWTKTSKATSVHTEMGSFYAVTTRRNYLRTQQHYVKNHSKQFLIIILGSAFKVILYHAAVYIYETWVYTFCLYLYPYALIGWIGKTLTFTYDIFYKPLCS